MNLLYKHIVTLIFIIFLNLTLYGNENSNVDYRGQFIVEVGSNSEFQSWFRTMKSDVRYTKISIENLMEVPFNLWLISIDNSNPYISDFEKILLKNKNILNCIKNRKIKLRQTPNDPLFPNQWQYENTGQNNGKVGADMDMIKAWGITTGGLTFSGDTIVVAVLDDGINNIHPDMKANMWVNHNEIPNNGIDDDNNGYVDDYYGWNVKTNNDNINSDGSHGTPVAGIIGAVGNNNEGVSGVNWNIKLLAIDYGEASEARALASYGYVYKMRQLWNETQGQKGAFITVTNASWGADELFADEAQLWCRMYDALGSIGVLNVAATSNSNVDVDEVGDMPSTCDSEFLIIVTNVNRQDIRHEGGGGSAFGKKSVDLGAFGHQTYTVTRSSYGAFGGTSGATPHVAGLAALMYSAPCAVFDSVIYAEPQLAALLVKDMLLLGTEANPTLEQITTTGGRVNAFNALSNLMLLCEGCSPPAGLILQSSDSSTIIRWPFDAGGDIAVRYRKSSESNWTTISGVKNGFEIMDLEFCEEYEIQWGAICGFLSGEFGYSKFFRTEGCCSLPEIDQVDIEEDKIGILLNHAENAVYNITYSINNGTVLDTLISSKEFQWAQLFECQTVKLTIQAQCLKHNNISPKSESFILSTPCGPCTENQYCQLGRKDNSQEWIQSLQIGEYLNNTKNEPNGYAHFFGFNQIRLNQGMSYPLIVEVGYKNDAFTEYFKLYIDFNQNGIYEETEEVFNQGPNTNIFTGDVEIPIEALGGYTSMRAILSFDSFKGPCDVLGFDYGEVEDYCVFIGPPCLGNVVLDTITKTTQTLTFRLLASSEDVDSVRIDFRAQGDDTWQTYFMQDTLWLDNLKACTIYEYRYYSVCDNVSSAEFVRDTIKTLCSNRTIETKDKIKVFPNPAKNILFVDLGGWVATDNSITLSTIDGQPIKLKDKIFYLNNRHEINISDLDSGIYLLTLRSENALISHYKIVVLK